MDGIDVLHAVCSIDRGVSALLTAAEARGAGVAAVRREMSENNGVLRLAYKAVFSGYMESVVSTFTIQECEKHTDEKNHDKTMFLKPESK